MSRRGMVERSPLVVLAVISVGLGALAALVTTSVDRLIADDDVSLSWAVTYGLLMAMFFFVVSVVRRRRDRG